jgi:hypothetical protein
MKAYWWRYGSSHSLTSALAGNEWLASRSASFTWSERDSGTHWIGSWVGPRAVLDTVVKRKIPSPCRESNPRTPIIQSVAQCYNDWAITALPYYMHAWSKEGARYPASSAVICLTSVVSVRWSLEHIVSGFDNICIRFYLRPIDKICIKHVCIKVINATNAVFDFICIFQLQIVIHWTFDHIWYSDSLLKSEPKVIFLIHIGGVVPSFYWSELSS